MVGEKLQETNKSFCRIELLEAEEKKDQLGFDDNFVDSLLC